MKGWLLLILLAFLTWPAQAQHQHPAQDAPIHEQFYSTWYMPDNPAGKCCDNKDCYPTEIRFENGKIFAKRREDGLWVHVPDHKIERNRDNPDGRNHVCMPPPMQNYQGHVYCFSLGTGG